MTRIHLSLLAALTSLLLAGFTGRARAAPTAAPAFDYLHLLGGSGTEQGAHLALGGGGSVFVAGTTSSTNWPNWPFPIKRRPCAQTTCSYAFLLKLNANGKSTFYDVAFGGSRDTSAAGVTVDVAGNAYLTGHTTSPDFPTHQPIQAHCGGAGGAGCDDGFIVKINPYGSVVYSTFLGGSGADRPTSVAVDRSGQAYVAGSTESTNFPTFHAAQPHLRGGSDGFVTKLDRAGRAFVYSTFLGGSLDDGIAGIAVDALGEAYLAGGTASGNFRTSPDSLQPRYIGGNCEFFPCSDAFIVKLGTLGRFLAGSFLGTPEDESALAVALDGSGNVYVAGFTGASRIPAHRLAPPVDKPLCGSEGDVQPCRSAFIVELTPWLRQLVYSRVIGGHEYDGANALAVSPAGKVLIGGYTESDNFPVVNAVQPSTGGGECSEAKGNNVPCDGFVATLAPHSRALSFSTYLGGNGTDAVEAVALTQQGDAIVAGTTWSTNFPTAGSPGTPPLTSAGTTSRPKIFVGRISGLG